MVTTPVGTGWTASVGDGTVVVSAGKVTFVNAANGANAFIVVTTEDNASYEVVDTVANRTGGSCSVTVAGATTAHQGVTTSRSTNGTFTETVTTSGAGSNTLRIQVTAKAAGTSLEVNLVSVKKVLR
jgi:predicted SpoU family rRNA methylase